MGSRVEGRWVAEESDDPNEAAIGVELGEVGAGDADVAVGADERPSVAGEAVVGVDTGRAAEPMPGVVTEHRIGDGDEAVVAGHPEICPIQPGGRDVP